MWTFNSEELQKIIAIEDKAYQTEKNLVTKGRGQAKRHLVKWRGWLNKFNSWVEASQVHEV